MVLWILVPADLKFHASTVVEIVFVVSSCAYVRKYLHSCLFQMHHRVMPQYNYFLRFLPKGVAEVTITLEENQKSRIRPCHCDH